MGYENYLNIFWKWLGTVGARVVQRCSLTFKHILLSLVQWWRPTQRNVHWENCSLQFIQTPILPMLNLEVTTCFYWITMCFHLWSGAILIHDLLWGFPKMWDPQTIAFSWKKNKQLWMICWVPKKFKKLPGSSSSFIISFAKLQKLPSELLLAQPASPLRATVSWTPDQKSRRAIEPFVAAPKILELGWCSNRVEEKCGFYWLKRSFQNDLWKPGIHRNTPNWNVNISIDLFSLQCFLL